MLFPRSRAATRHRLREYYLRHASSRPIRQGYLRYVAAVKPGMFYINADVDVSSVSDRSGVSRLPDTNDCEVRTVTYSR